MYLKPRDGSKDAKKCMQLAKRAQEKHAAEVKEERRETRLQTSLFLRPLQPVWVDSSGDAEVVRPKDDSGWVKVRILETGAVVSESYSKVRLIGAPEPICLRDFFRRNNDLPQQKETFHSEELGVASSGSETFAMS
jgi:hypothetical protein